MYFFGVKESCKEDFLQIESYKQLRCDDKSFKALDIFGFRYLESILYFRVS